MSEYYRQIDKVKVTKDFPGFNVGDVLIRYYDDTFVLDSTTMEVDSFRSSWRLDPSDVVPNIGPEGFFEDLTPYEVKTREQIEKAIEKIKGSIEDEDVDYEAVLVWNNLIYCLEWVLGRREYLEPETNENVQENNKG